MGRKPQLNEKQKAEARQRLIQGEVPRELALIFGVSRSTIARLR
jgi:transposase